VLKPRRAADAVDIEIEFGLRADAVPFGLRGFENEEEKKGGSRLAE